MWLTFIDSGTVIVPNSDTGFSAKPRKGEVIWFTPL